MRRRLYQVSTAKLIEIFRQDYSLELSLYQNHILFDGDANVEAGGVITSTELAIFGNRKLGVVREVRLERDLSSDKARQNASSRKNKLLSEFVFLFRAYLADRHFATIKEYYLGFYRELSMEYRKLPRKSELAAFYRFLDLSMSKIKPLDYLWKKYVRPNEEKGGLLLKLLGSVEQENSGAAIPLLLFTEAGKTDSTGQYILNGEARGFIRSGLKTRIYPSFTFSDSF